MRGTNDVSMVQLRDGRSLAWAEYGDPSGKPVLYFHGFPGSRIEPALGADDLARTEARLIAIDRPGFGGSTFQPGRRLLDWPNDVASFADSLALDRFACMGVSGGGPYVLACALRLGERLTRAAIVCGVGPLDTADGCLRPGTRGAGLEAQLYARPWGFRLEDVLAEIDLYQGELDVNVAPSMGRYQAGTLPHCKAHFFPTDGHFSLAVNRMEEVVRRLVS